MSLIRTPKDRIEAHRLKLLNIKKLKREKEVTKKKKKELEEKAIEKAKKKEFKKYGILLPETVKGKKNRCSWRILMVSQNKKFTEVCYVTEKEDALYKFSKILEENKKDVRFPIKVSSRNHIHMKAKYELLLLERNREEVDNETMLRNEIGQFAPNRVNSNKWLLYQKAEFLLEESFWVYGYNPKAQRKDFYWVLNDLLLKDVLKVKYPMKRVTVYKNKLVIDADEDFDIVICKCENDAIRLYNELEKEITKLKLKSIFFSGFTREAIKDNLIEKIMKKTGWDFRKTTRVSTRP